MLGNYVFGVIKWLWKTFLQLIYSVLITLLICCVLFCVWIVLYYAEYVKKSPNDLLKSIVDKNKDRLENQNEFEFPLIINWNSKEDKNMTLFDHIQKGIKDKKLDYKKDEVIDMFQTLKDFPTLTLGDIQLINEKGELDVEKNNYTYTESKALKNYWKFLKDHNDVNSIKNEDDTFDGFIKNGKKTTNLKQNLRNYNKKFKTIRDSFNDLIKSARNSKNSENNNNQQDYNMFFVDNEAHRRNLNFIEEELKPKMRINLNFIKKQLSITNKIKFKKSTHVLPTDLYNDKVYNMDIETIFDTIAITLSLKNDKCGGMHYFEGYGDKPPKNLVVCVNDHDEYIYMIDPIITASSTITNEYRFSNSLCDADIDIISPAAINIRYLVYQPNDEINDIYRENKKFKDSISNIKLKVPIEKYSKTFKDKYNQDEENENVKNGENENNEISNFETQRNKDADIKEKMKKIEQHFIDAGDIKSGSKNDEMLERFALIMKGVEKTDDYRLGKVRLVEHKFYGKDAACLSRIISEMEKGDICYQDSP
jgi:hypothetical protein